SDQIRTLFQREIAESAEMLRRAFAAGVPLLCGTESGFSLTPYGDWHYRELEVFVRDLGLTPLQAIACATSHNAFALRLEGRTGALAAGYLADLLVVDGDVARDVTVLGRPSRIRHVILNGEDARSPLPPRRDPPGWRVVHYGKQILRREMVEGRDPASDTQFDTTIS
ncbi:MAG: amidohydrolase family protein, partial [Gammaproteobacteria bacterium]